MKQFIAQSLIVHRTTDPTTSDNLSRGFDVESEWYNGVKFWKLTSFSGADAIWELIGGASGGAEVTDLAKIAALKLVTNWVNPNDSDDLLYYLMTNNLPTGQNEHDYYIGIDTSTNTAFRYAYEKIDTNLNWIRMPLQISISGL